jgi:hypothetical protein
VRFVADAVLVTGRTWLILSAAALAGAVVLSLAVQPHVGSGRSCEGIGFGCTPERQTDAALVAAVYSLATLASLVVAGWRDRRGRPWRRTLAAGMAITTLATGAAIWTQLPRHPASPGSLSEARERWERVLADGMAAAPPGTPLGDALRGLEQEGPLGCRDAYGRHTGARTVRWSNRGGMNAYAGSSDSSGALTAAALGRWAERLRARGVDATVTDPSGDPAEERRLATGRSGPAGGGALYVRASFYTAELEITAGTGCHRE